MAKAIFESKDFDKLFNALAEVNPQEAEVATHLSGQAQLLKSSAKAVAYRNLNGQTINENLFVQDEHNQTIQTNHHDMIESGVTTDKTEHAPQINQERTLSQGRVHSVNTHNLNANTTDERHTLNQRNVKAFHQSLTSNIPTKLDSSIEQSGQSTINQQQQKIDTQVIHSAQYEQAFGQYTHSGKVKFGSTANVGTKKLLIGSGNPQNIDFTLQKVAGLYFPKTSAKIYSKELKLPAIVTKNFLVKGSIALSGEMEALSHDSVNPATFDEHGFGVDLKRVMNKYFGNMHFESVLHIDEPSKPMPGITVEYNHGDFEFSQGVQFNPKPGCTEIDYSTVDSVPVHLHDYLGWELKVNSSATLKAQLYYRGKSSGLENRIKKYADEALSEFWQVFKQLVLKPALKNVIAYDPAVPAVEQGIEAGLPVEVELFDLIFVPAEDGVLLL